MKSFLLSTTVLASLMSWQILLASGQFLPTSSYESESDDSSAQISPYQSPLSRLVQSAGSLYRSPLSSFTGGSSSSSFQPTSSSEDTPSSSDVISGIGDIDGLSGVSAGHQHHYQQQQPLQRSPTHNSNYHINSGSPRYHSQQSGYNPQLTAGLYGGGSSPSLISGSQNIRSNANDEDRDDDEPSSIYPRNGGTNFGMIKENGGGGNGFNNYPTNSNNNNNNNNNNNDYNKNLNNYNNYNNDDDSADENDEDLSGTRSGRMNGGLKQSASHQQRGQPNMYNLAGSASGYGSGFSGDPNTGFGFDLSGLAGFNPYGGGQSDGFASPQANKDSDEDSSEQTDDQPARAKAASAPGYGTAYNQIGGQYNNVNPYQQQNVNRQRNSDSYDNDGDGDDD